MLKLFRHFSRVDNYGLIWKMRRVASWNYVRIKQYDTVFKSYYFITFQTILNLWHYNGRRSRFFHLQGKALRPHTLCSQRSHTGRANPAVFILLAVRSSLEFFSRCNPTFSQSLRGNGEKKDCFVILATFLRTGLPGYLPQGTWKINK